MSILLNARANVKVLQYYEIYKGIESAAISFVRNSQLNPPGIERVIDSLVAFTYLYQSEYPFLQANAGKDNIPRSGIARKIGLKPIPELKKEDLDLSLLITGCGFLLTEHGNPSKIISAKLAQRILDPMEPPTVQATPIARIVPSELNIQVPSNPTKLEKEKYLPTDLVFLSLAFIQTLR